MAGQLFNPALTLMERGYLSANNAELLPSCCFPPAIPFKRLANPFRPPVRGSSFGHFLLLWPFFCSPCRAPSSPPLRRMPYNRGLGLQVPCTKRAGSCCSPHLVTRIVRSRGCKRKAYSCRRQNGERERCPRQREQDASAGSLLSFSAPLITFFRRCFGEGWSSAFSSAHPL